MSELATVLARLRAVDGYNALTVLCPKCGGDVQYHVGEHANGEVFVTDSGDHCCRLGIRHLNHMDAAAYAAIDRLLEQPA